MFLQRTITVKKKTFLYREKVIIQRQIGVFFKVSFKGANEI